MESVKIRLDYNIMYKVYQFIPQVLGQEVSNKLRGNLKCIELYNFTRTHGFNHLYYATS